MGDPPHTFTMPRQPEGKLVQKARALLKSRGARAFKIQGGDESFQEVGIPDILCCYRGRFLGLEAKMPGGKPTAKQKAILNEIVDCGGYSVVFTTVGEVSHLLVMIDKEVAREGGRNTDDLRRDILQRSLHRTS